jgi:hypothetical protein
MSVIAWCHLTAFACDAHILLMTRVYILLLVVFVDNFGISHNSIRHGGLYLCNDA